MTEIALTPGERRRSLAIAIACTSVVGTTMGLTWPLLALILDAQGVDSTLIGLSSASQSLAILAIAPIATRLIARLGPVRTITSCISIAILALCLLPLFPNVYAWFPIRFMLGGSVLLLFIAGETWVNQVAANETRGRVIGLFGFLWSAGFAIGPLIIPVTGIEGWPPFLVGILLVLVGALPLLFARRVAPVIEAQRATGMMTLLGQGGVALLAAPMLGAVDAINDSLFPLYALQSGLSQTTAVTALTMLFVGTTVGHVPVGWLADRMDRRRLLAGSTAFTLVTTLMLPAVIGHPWLLWPVVLLWGAALGGIWTVAIVLLGEQFRGSVLATANTMYGVLYGLGAVVGPAVTGVAMHQWAPLAMPLLVALFCLLYLPLTFRRY